MNNQDQVHHFWIVRVGEKEKFFEFKFVPLTLTNTMEVQLDPSILRKIMDLVQNEKNYHLFLDVSTVEHPDDSFVPKDVEFITIIARNTKTLPYGILILFESNAKMFKIEALWPEDFAAVCQKTPQILNAAVKALIERPEDFLGVSIYSIRKK